MPAYSNSSISQSESRVHFSQGFGETSSGFYARTGGYNYLSQRSDEERRREDESPGSPMEIFHYVATTNNSPGAFVVRASTLDSGYEKPREAHKEGLLRGLFKSCCFGNNNND